MEKPFQGLRTFLKATTDVSNLKDKLCVVGIPFDCATTNRPGARFGPAGVRDASLMLTDGVHPLWNIDPTRHLVDLGDIPVSNTNISKSLEQITGFLDHYVYGATDQRQSLCIGGDHAVTLGILRSVAKRHGPLAMIHFDAHSDTSIDHMGDPVGHGTWLRNAIDEGLVNPEKTISIGVRAPGGETSRHYLAERGGRTISARDAMRGDFKKLMFECWDIIGETPTYLSLDIDSLDPSMAPGTGTPEIAGLTTAWVLDAMEEMGELSFNWAGMDVVEVAPAYDNSQITALAAATFAWTYACMIAKDK